MARKNNHPNEIRQLLQHYEPETAHEAIKDLIGDMIQGKKRIRCS